MLISSEEDLSILTDRFITRLRFIMQNALETQKAITETIAQEMLESLKQIERALETDTLSANNVVRTCIRKVDLTLVSLSDKPLSRDELQLHSATSLINEALDEYVYDDDMQRDLIEVCGDDFRINVEPNLFKHVIFNLLQNALFHMKAKAQAKIVITLRPDIAGEHCIEFHDTGPGIPPEQIPILFNTYMTPTKEGVGLGLPFCKRTMESFEGDIHCESEVGKYTHFMLSFPILLECSHWPFSRKALKPTCGAYGHRGQTLTRPLAKMLPVKNREVF